MKYEKTLKYKYLEDDSDIFIFIWVRHVHISHLDG